MEKCFTARENNKINVKKTKVLCVHVIFVSQEITIFNNAIFLQQEINANSKT